MKQRNMPSHLDWVRLTDSKGRTYYYNSKNSTSQWDAPPDFREPTPRTFKSVQAKGVVLPDREPPKEQQQQPVLKRSFSADRNGPGASSLSNGDTPVPSSGGGGLLRTVQSLAGFSSRGSKTQTTSRSHQKWVDKASSTLKAAAALPSGPSSGQVIEDRRYWGRPDRLRTESGEDLLNSVSDPAYRFRTSSSALWRKRPQTYPRRATKVH